MLETSGLSGMCGSGSSSITASSTPSSPSPGPQGSSAPSGVPLGSYEIGNLGVSPATPVPTTTVAPIRGSIGSPTMTTAAPASSASSTTGNTIP
jgi:hypothetical protein